MTESSTAQNPHWLRSLGLPALGVVFGDIGTSPLYTLRECLAAAGGEPQEAVILGVLSLIVWTLIIVVALKYVVFVMRPITTARAASWRCWPWRITPSRRAHRANGC